MSERETKLYLTDILEAIEAIEGYVVDINWLQFTRSSYRPTCGCPARSLVCWLILVLILSRMT